VRQAKVWDSVRKAQERLSSGAGADVRSLQSASSLQLALENEKLAAARDAYVMALKAAGEKDDDIIGFVFAVNGKLNSGDAYMSNALFRKMWPKLLAASAVEAVGRRHEAAVEPPAAQAADDFLKQADAGKASERPLDFGMRRVLHEADSGYLIEAKSSSGWVHRSYLAK
jgi:ARG and Rhodanese-Phosphatase-superfamily-associated Protein domain